VLRKQEIYKESFWLGNLGKEVERHTRIAVRLLSEF
jgi:hypothetical protein